MRWWKRMSATDAQQPTSGRIVPYLRFIRGKNPHYNQTWFRQFFFGGLNWGPGFFGQHAVEQSTVAMDVSIAGKYKGTRTFLVTHDSSRMLNNNTPNTWLHYDAATLADLNAVNTAGMIFSVEYLNGVYKLDIS